MTKEQIEIIRMARDAGFEHWFDVVGEQIIEPLDIDEYLVNPVVKQSFRTVHVEVMERFAAMAAAKEREACAEVCEEVAETVNSRWIARDCARGIRARGAQ